MTFIAGALSDNERFSDSSTEDVSLAPQGKLWAPAGCARGAPRQKLVPYNSKIIFYGVLP